MIGSHHNAHCNGSLLYHVSEIAFALLNLQFGDVKICNVSCSIHHAIHVSVPIKKRRKTVVKIKCLKLSIYHEIYTLISCMKGNSCCEDLIELRKDLLILQFGQGFCIRLSQ